MFRAYHEAVRFAPLLLLALALAVVTLVHSESRWRHRGIAIGLGVLWLWSGIVYHWMFFSSINPAARLFGALFVAQGLLFVGLAAFGDRLQFRPSRSGRASGAPLPRHA